MAGVAEPSDAVWRWFKQARYEELSAEEPHNLDLLAEVLAQGPSVEALVAFSQRAPTLRQRSIEQDRYSFLFAA